MGEVLELLIEVFGGLVSKLALLLLDACLEERASRKLPVRRSGLAGSRP